MKKLVVNFIGNLKKYVDYLMSVNFGELFVNVLILICILLLSVFIFVPVGMVETIIRDFINLFGNSSEIFYLVYNWIFTLISTILSAFAFMYMFNKRFDDIEAFKNQIKEKTVEKVIEKNNKEELELPKTKDGK